MPDEALAVIPSNKLLKVVRTYLTTESIEKTAKLTGLSVKDVEEFIAEGKFVDRALDAKVNFLRLQFYDIVPQRLLEIIAGGNNSRETVAAANALNNILNQKNSSAPEKEKEKVSEQDVRVDKLIRELEAKTVDAEVIRESSEN